MSASAEYTVIQFVPDPLADERVNIGVVVIADGQVTFEFLSNYSRVRHFAGQADLHVVHDFRDRLMMLASSGVSSAQAELPVFGGGAPSAVAFVRNVAENWNHQIQCTPLQPSLDRPERLLERLKGRYLKSPTGRSNREGISKSTITSRAAKELRIALPFDVAPRYQVEVNQPESGRIIPEIVVDLSLKNGELRAAGQSASFQLSDPRDVRRAWNEALLSLDDLRQVHDGLFVSLHVAPPRPHQRQLVPEYEDAIHAANRADIEVVPTAQVADWARALANEATKSLA